MRAFLLCARLEFRLALRSRWTQTFAVVFSVLALAVASSGYVLSGGYGVQDLARTSASLVQLVALLTPLMALLGGVSMLLPEAGAAEILYAQPFPRRVLLLGRVAGLFAALVLAQAVGFAAAGAVVLRQAGPEGAGAFVLLALGAAALTAIFLGCAAAIAAGGSGRRRARATAVALCLWFGMVVLYDVVALGAASILPSGQASRLLIVSVLVNPVDAVRTGSLLLAHGTTAFGAASLAFLRVTGGPARAGGWLTASLLAWAVIPLILASGRVRRADL
jgi:Cu-processing system permease protein